MLYKRKELESRGAECENIWIWGLGTLRILHLGTALPINVSEKSMEHYKKEINLTTQHFTNPRKT